MPKFKRKPTFCEAEQFTESHTPKGVCPPVPDDGYNYVTTIQGQDVKVQYGEWIVMESDGIHYYPIADEEFKRIYEPSE